MKCYLCNQIVNEGTFFLVEDFQQIYAEGMLELECYPSVAANEIVGLGRNQPCLLAP